MHIFTINKHIVVIRPFSFEVLLSFARMTIFWPQIINIVILTQSKAKLRKQKAKF